MFEFKLLVSAIIFVLMDSMYLNLIKSYFVNQIEVIQGTPIKLNLPAILMCYIFLIFGINYFIIKPHRSIQDAFLLGIIIYGVYETTNLALFSKWSWITFLIDTLWGGILFASTTFLVNYLF